MLMLSWYTGRLRPKRMTIIPSKLVLMERYVSSALSVLTPLIYAIVRYKSRIDKEP